MSFISYAQNFEDVMLWRALKHVKSGFYIDLGAWSPDLDSVTRLFYENGWRGINIEPNPEFHMQYLTKREKDINLKVAVGNTIGETDVFFSTNPGLSSLDKDIAESHKNIGWDVIPARVEVTTIKNICEKYCHNQEIHFLKIDIEGYEKQALLGNDWSKFRPWIVVVEATLPMSQIENHQDWEYILLGADYDFVYADGLNRFYVAQEHRELKSAFQHPPNVFDGFVLANQVQAEQRVNQAKEEAHKWWNNAHEAEKRVNVAEQRVNDAEKRANAAEQRVNEANARVTQAEQSVNEAKEEAHKWWNNAHEANAREMQLIQQLNIVSDIQRMQKDRLEKGPFRLRQLLRHPRKFWNETMGTQKNRTPEYRHLARGFIDKEGRTYFSLRWIVRQPRKAIKLMFRQPKKTIGFALRQPRKFLLGKVIKDSELQIRKETGLQIQNLELSHLSPRAKQIYLQIKDTIEQQKASK